jgi:hypothetical protein
MDEAHNGAEPDHGFGDLWQRFIIDQQATREPARSKRLFHAPALGQQHKALCELRASNNLDYDPQARQRDDVPAIGLDPDSPDGSVCILLGAPDLVAILAAYDIL